VAGNVPGLPAYAWVAKIDASRHEACTAYVAVDQHRMDDFRPYAFKTTDCGESWTDLSGGLPRDDYVKVIREDPRNAELLYAGMERGIFASWDGGRSWVSIRNNLPPVSVRDIQIHPRENDLIIGTHGRGAWILDDIGPLQGLAEMLGRTTAGIFPARAAVRWQTGSRDASLGQREYQASNPPYGAYINYYLGEQPQGPVKVTIADGDGQVIREIEVEEPRAGVNRTVWDLRHEGPDSAESERREGEGGHFFGGGGPLAVPGSYTAAIAVGDQTLSTAVTVEADPNVPIGLDDYRAQLEAALRLRELTSRVNGVIDDAASLEKQLTDLKATVEGAASTVEDSERLTEAMDAALKEIDALQDRLVRPIPGLGYRQTPRLREEIRSLNGGVSGMASRPTEAELLRLEELEAETAEVEGALDAIVSTRVAELNGMLDAYPRILLSRPR